MHMTPTAKSMNLDPLPHRYTRSFEIFTKELQLKVKMKANTPTLYIYSAYS